MEKIFSNELTGEELYLGGFISDGHPYVLGCSLVDALGKDTVESVDTPPMMISRWTFVAFLDEEKRIERVVINTGAEDGEENADAFLEEYDEELEKKLGLEMYLYPYEVERYFGV